MKKGIFRRIFLMYTLLMLFSFFFVEIYIAGAVKKNYIENLKKNLTVQLRVIAPLITFDRPDTGELCRTLKEQTGARMTVMSKDGTVLGDSDGDASLMDNHFARPEIRESLVTGTGSAIRYSETLNNNFLYVSRKISRGEVVEGFLRMGVPLEEVEHAIRLLRIKIVLVVGIVLLATGFFFITRTNRLRRLLGQIGDFSESLARGEIDKRLFLEGAGEFDEIAGNLNTMSATLQKMIGEHEEEEKRLNVILNSIPDALFIIDAKGTILLASSSARELFGGVSLVGKQYLEIVRSHEFSGLMDNVRRSMLPGTTEFRLDQADERYLAARISPLSYGDTELSGFIVVLHDITQLRKMELVRKDFVVNVSHEIKTPITAIKGFADTLLDGASQDEVNARKFLEMIKSNSERINSLVDDLMIISRLELGVIKVEKTLVDFEEVASHVEATLKEKAFEKNIYLEMSIPRELRTIEADRNRLIQILINLVGNAIKFTETGGVRFGISKNNGKTFLFVEDTGIGIPRKHLPRLGERFYRVDPARSRNAGGTGLGLAIVKHLVRAHGWEMEIVSTQGKGTTVRIRIPGG